jgi:hypothetical protein
MVGTSLILAALAEVGTLEIERFGRMWTKIPSEGDNLGPLVSGLRILTDGKEQPGVIGIHFGVTDSDVPWIRNSNSAATTSRSTGLCSSDAYSWGGLKLLHYRVVRIGEHATAIIHGNTECIGRARY